MVHWVKAGLISILIALLLLLFAAALLLVGSPTGKDWLIPFRLTRTATLHLKVAPMLAAATSPQGRRLLAGSRWRTRAGTVTLADRDGALVARCAPCEVRIVQLSSEPLRLSAMTLALQRDGNRVSGWVAAANGGAEQRLIFSGALDARALALNWELPRSEIAGVLELLRSAVPEAGRATILGHFSAAGTLSLPSGKWSISPRLEGFEVYGLGTERLRYGAVDFVCRDASGTPQLRHGGDRAPGWLAPDRMGRALPRAVLAAEDGRFYQHPGYDLEELVPLLADAERNGRRGASTLSQQLAKNLYTGADRNGARKLRELLYAVEMERTLGKWRILALYLNTVDWGPGICGAADAARVYFARAPEHLNPVQAAWLGGILRNPQRAYRQEFLTRTPEARRLKWVLAQTPRVSRRHRLGWDAPG
ncbi:hypothetical protein SKTS_08290 [Sulfurimicrobium lacus]|uniref:Glycosyl transferase family 51 domain-containing protein n=1 Tax=Sulfurimicrobium lacus TaxID=2715678 RepID=A0A6F8V7X8_9PROT|nr:biosynthetic peptidoglycan transglycosylase [Sulfurimicrobium lacus]BCB25943.1 hypothetical protein SKTS_08290 [Sulfurimicrobium lacus]